MADQCIFCKIVAGSIPAYKIHEDDHCIAILDAFPVTTGHTLVIPKKHAHQLHDLDASEAAHAFQIAQQVAVGIAKLESVSGYNVVQNNGKTAGQVIPHVHIHVLPRKNGDGLLPFPEGSKVDDAAAKALVQTIKANMQH
jgi:histidine triad (HIT) family protein